MLIRLKDAEEHVERGREIVAAQKALVASIKERGGDARVAEDLLSQFERSLVLFENDLRELRIKSGSRAS